MAKSSRRQSKPGVQCREEGCDYIPNPGQEWCGKHGGAWIEGKCEAMARGTKKQCTRPPRKGLRPNGKPWHICQVHGAGYKKREESGEKQTAGRPMTSGLFSQRLKGELREDVEYYMSRGKALFDLVPIAARTWALLAQAEAVVEKAYEVMAQDNDGVTVDMVSRATSSFETVLSRLQSLTALHNKLEAGEGGITPMEMVAYMRLFATWVQDACADTNTPREQIPDRLLDRMMAWSEGRVSIALKGEHSTEE